MKIFLDPNANTHLSKFSDNMSKFAHSTISSTTNLGITYNNGATVVATDNQSTKNLTEEIIISPIIVSTPEIILVAEINNLITPAVAQVLYAETSTSSDGFQSYKRFNERRVAKKFLKIFNICKINSPNKFEGLFKNVF